MFATPGAFPEVWLRFPRVEVGAVFGKVWGCAKRRSVGKVGSTTSSLLDVLDTLMMELAYLGSLLPGVIVGWMRLVGVFPWVLGVNEGAPGHSFLHLSRKWESHTSPCSPGIPVSQQAQPESSQIPQSGSAHFHYQRFSRRPCCQRYCSPPRRCSSSSWEC
jgi:hypothetical protein